MRLKVKLPDGWTNYGNPEGPLTYCRELSETPGPLQLSWAEYKGGTLPNPTANDLKRMSEDYGGIHDLGGLIESSSDSCKFGMAGTAIFRSIEYPRIQVWHLSNGRDFIMVTHICPAEPDPIEVSEAQEIVRNISTSET